MIAATAAAAGIETPISERGPSPRKVIVGYGFWLFLLSDIILFSALFAAYAVLSAAPPTARRAPGCSIATAC